MDNITLKKKTISGLLFKTVERVLLQGVTLVISIILARLLMPEDYGNVTLLLVFITLLEVVITYGFGAALIQKKESDSLDFSTCFYFSLVLSGALYLIIFFTSPLIALFYGNESLTLMIKIIGIKIIFSGINSIQSAYIAKNFLFKRSMIISAIATLVSGGIGIYLAVLGYGEWSLIIQTVLSSALLVLLTFIFVRMPLQIRFSFCRLKSLFGFGWKLMAIGFLNTGYDELRSLIIGKRYSTVDLAYYDKGRNFPKLISNNVNAIIDGVIFSTMSNVQDDCEKVVNVLSRSIRIGLYVLSPMLIGLAAVSKELILLLYTAKWESAAIYLEILSFSFLLVPVITLNMNALKSIGKSGLLLKIDIIKKIIGIFLIAVSSFFGVFYIAVSVPITYLIWVAIHCATSKIVFRYSLKRQVLDIIIPMLPAVIMGACVYSINFIPLSNSFSFLLKIAVGMLSFLIFSLVLKNDSFLYLLSAFKSIKNKSRDSREMDGGENGTEQ